MRVSAAVFPKYHSVRSIYDLAGQDLGEQVQQKAAQHREIYLIAGENVSERAHVPYSRRVCYRQ